MANRVSTVVAAIETALNMLVPGTLAVAYRRSLVPLKEVNLPAAGVWVSGVAWERGPPGGPAQTANLVVDLAVRQGTGEIDETILDVAAEIESALITAAAADGGLGGGALTSFRVEPWIHIDHDKALVPIGAMIFLVVTVDGKLKNE